MQIKSESIELVSVDALIPHPKNMHNHPPEQIERLCKLIEYQGFRTPLTVQRGTNLIVTGNGRLMAAKKLGMEKVPVTYQEFDDDAQIYAHIVADNAIGKDTWATLDLSQINLEIQEHGPDFDVDMLGLKNFTVDPVDKLEDEVYTGKIETPIYEPSENKPSVNELYDESKTMQLVDQIESSGIDGELKEFLISAAQRHTVFSYKKIADYYAHSGDETRDLFEKSALVIIDYDKAIENGFIELTKDMAKAYSNG